MDTGTHVLFGLGLGGLSMLDPVLAAEPFGSVAVVLGTVIGSIAPDFDGVIRIKSNADYIKNHRGLSHSFPFTALWAGAITLGLALSFRSVSWWHLGLWVLLAVVVHVFVDLFNSYGTQALRPVSKRRVAWNIIHAFDPVIFSAHLLALFLWMAGLADPRAIFPALYVLLAIYYVWRTLVHRRLVVIVPERDESGAAGDRYAVLPTLSLYKWNVVRTSPDGTYWFGVWEHNGRIEWVDAMKGDDHPAVEASKQNANVQALLEVTPFPCGQVKAYSWGYEVRWSDVRYRYRKQYPFVAVVMMDAAYEPLQSYVGWLSDERLEKRLRMNTY